MEIELPNVMYIGGIGLKVEGALLVRYKQYT